MASTPSAADIDRSGYDRGNAAFIGSVDTSGIRRIAELACGNGELTRAIVGRWPSAAVCALDPEPVALEHVRRMLEDRGLDIADLEGWRSGGRRGGPGLACILEHDHEAGGSLPFRDGEADLVVMGNAAHLVPDRAALFAEIARVLRPGGTFAFNTGLFVGALPEETAALWTEWARQARLALDRSAMTRAATGEAARRPGQGAAPAARSVQFLAPEEWEAEVAAAGFDTVDVGQRAYMLDPGGLAFLATLPGVREQLMSGQPPDVALECLIASAPAAFEALGIQDPVPRRWLEIRARKG